jgi:hypothetical protein
MDTFTVETMTGSVTDADVAGLVDSLVGLWRDDAGRHDRSINEAWPHQTGAAYLRDLFGDPNGLVLAVRGSVRPTSSVRCRRPSSRACRSAATSADEASVVAWSTRSSVGPANAGVAVRR